jgi:phage terminase large subunit-like protein
MLHPYGFYDKIGTWYDQEDTYGQDMKHIKLCEKNGDPVKTKVYLRPCWWPNAAAVKAGKVESEMTEHDYELWFNVPGQLTYAFLRGEMHDVEGFAIKYLNDPTKAHTVKFPRELLERRTINSNLLPQTGLIVTCVDTAYSTKSWADYTVIITALIYGGRFYIIDMKRGRYNEYELPQIIAAVANQWRPVRLCIEDSVGVKWLGKEIYREMDKLRVRVPIEFVPLGQGNKASAKDMKAKPVLRYLGDERMLFANQCVGLEELYTELANFGTAASTHDDIVSALSILVDQFASYADMEGKKQEASPDFVISSQAKQQYDHIYGKGVYGKVFQQKAYSAALNNPDVPIQEAVKAEQAAAASFSDPLADAGLYN